MDTKRSRSTDSIDSEEERDVIEHKETAKQLCSEVRDILSQLTSKNFQKYLIRIRNLKINTCEKMHGVVDLIFEEIVNYESCALLCRELVLMPMLKSEKIKQKFGFKFTTFRMLLYVRCEVEMKKILTEDKYLINIMFVNNSYWVTEEEKEVHNKGEHFEKQLHETSINFIKFVGELHRQFVITNDILMKFMVNVITDMEPKYFKCINYLMSAINKELQKDSCSDKWTTRCQNTLESKVIRQRTDNKHVPEKSVLSISEKNICSSKELASNSSSLREIKDDIKKNIDKKDRNVYSLEKLLLLQNVPSSRKLPKNYDFILSLNLDSVPRESIVCLMQNKISTRPLTVQTDIQDAYEYLGPTQIAVDGFFPSPPTAHQTGISNDTTIIVPSKKSKQKRQKSKQLPIDPNAAADPAAVLLVSPINETLSQDNTATLVDPQKSKLNHKFALITDLDTGRQMYKSVKNQEKKSKSNPKSNQSSACQPVQSLDLNVAKLKTKKELHKLVNKTITKLTPSSLKLTTDMIKNLKAKNTMIDNCEYVNNVIEIIMERATSKFESSALLCKELDQMQVPTMDRSGITVIYRTFGELLLDQCMKNLYNVPFITEENVISEDEIVFLRLKHVGLVQFAKELYKHQMFSDKLVMDFIKHLLKNWRDNSEGNLECVCRLFLLFGKELEVGNINLNSDFNTLKQICNNKQQKLSNLLRHMSQSVYDLWKAKWSPEKQEICHILQNAYNPRMTKTELMRIICSYLKKKNIKSFKKVKIDTYKRLKLISKMIFDNVPVCPQYCSEVCMALLNVKVPHVKTDTFDIIDIRKFLRDKCAKEMGKPGFTELKPEYSIFIGYLYEKELIASKILVKWLVKLLEIVKEKSMESVHKLLVQVGEQLEKDGTDLNPQYNRINKIVQTQYRNISKNVLAKLNDLVTWRNAKLSLERILPQSFQTIANQPDINVQIKLFEELQRSTLSNNSSEQLKVITKKGIQTVQTSEISDPLNPLQLIYGKGLLMNQQQSEERMLKKPSYPNPENDISLPYHLQNDEQLPSTCKLNDVSSSTFSFTEIHKKLKTFFSLNTPINEVIEWIQTNVGEAKEEEPFIRALMTAILQQCIVNNKLNDQALKNYYQYIHRLYIGASDSVEVYCLYAVQTFFLEMGFPEGLLLATFRKLYDDSIIIPESFLMWKDCTDSTKQAGKSDALEQLTAFFEDLKITEYEDM